MKIRVSSMAATAIALLGAGGTGAALAGDLTANVAVANNYIWRGLTQNENGAAVQGGLDYTADSGFYVGTWASNVTYVPADPFSYEHDIYLGFRGGRDAHLGRRLPLLQLRQGGELRTSARRISRSAGTASR